MTKAAALDCRRCQLEEWKGAVVGPHSDFAVDFVGHGFFVLSLGRHRHSGCGWGCCGDMVEFGWVSEASDVARGR